MADTGPVDIDRIYHVSNRPPRLEDWRRPPGDGSRAFVTPDAPRLPAGQDLAGLRELWTYRLDRLRLEALLAASNLELLSISGSHVADLAFLASQQHLRGLGIDWNNKVRSVDVLARLEALEILSLQDLRHVHDLAPLGTLANLHGLQIAGGMDTRMEIASLDPLAGLGLVDLRLANVRISDGRLEALAALPRLETLTIARSVAPAAEFARMAARVPLLLH